jgi:hypothetical protein
LNGLSALVEVLHERRRHVRGQSGDRVAELLGGVAGRAALTCGHGLAKPVEPALQVVGVVARQQTVAATAGDDKGDREAEPAGKECAGSKAHPGLTLEAGTVGLRLRGGWWPATARM